MVQSKILVALSALLSAQVALAAPNFLQKRATISPNGQCGAQNGFTCQGSNFGNSCGRYNLCGNQADYSYSKLSQGCQPAFGYCVPRGSVSPDGSCSGSDGFICIGSNFGDSCGRNNLCGRDAGYSGDGCQPQFGYCQRCTTTLAGGTSTTTVRTTITATTVATVSTSTAVGGGTSTTSTATTATTTLNTGTTQTVTVTSTPTTTSSVTTTVTTTVSSGTVTTTTSASITFVKRGAPSKFTVPKSVKSPTVGVPPARTGDAKLVRRAPGDPAGLSCGTIVTTGAAPTTTTVSQTTTVVVTSTSTAVATGTLSGTVVTVTSTAQTTQTVTSTTTTTTTTTAPLRTNTVSTTATTTTTVPAATTTSVIAAGVYRKVAENPNTSSCTYNRYFSRTGASTDPTNNYAAARNQCAALCDRTPACVFFFFDRFDQGGSFTECLLDSLPYDSNQLNCQVSGTTLYYAAYNKVS